jgi:hypothetical protein
MRLFQCHLKLTYPSLTYPKIRSNGGQEGGQSKLLQSFSKNRTSGQLGRQYWKNHNNSTKNPDRVIPKEN